MIFRSLYFITELLKDSKQYLKIFHIIFFLNLNFLKTTYIYYELIKLLLFLSFKSNIVIFCEIKNVQE